MLSRLWALVEIIKAILALIKELKAYLRERDKQKEDQKDKDREAALDQAEKAAKNAYDRCSELDRNQKGLAQSLSHGRARLQCGR